MKPYIIADTTYNHEGDVNYLLKMIDELAELKVQAVKFHLMFDIDDYMAKTHPAYQKIKDMLIPEKQWDSIIYYAKAKGLDVVLLCDDLASLIYAMKKNVHEIELHSSAITDHRLLELASSYKGRIMLGIGGATDEEIRGALSFFESFFYESNSDNVTLMFGFNGWSTNTRDINLQRMIRISQEYGVNVGYADHTFWDLNDNVFVSCCAAFAGFNILEKHYTCDPGVERVDFKESVGKDRMREIQRLMTVACEVYGDDHMSPAEMNFAVKIRKVDGLRR